TDEGQQATGYAAQAMLAAQLKAYLLVNLEPELDCANPAMARAAMQAAECVIALSSFKSEGVLAVAHVLFPLAAFAETAGTFINIEGTWQSFQAAIPPLGEARPGWKILHTLSNTLGIVGADYTCVEAVRDAVKAVVPAPDRQQLF